jgi:hypothetical protein
VIPARARQVLPYGVMLVAAALMFWAAGRIEVDTGGRIGPAVWPKTIIVILGLLCIYEIVKRLLAAQASVATGLLGGLNANPAGSPETGKDVGVERGGEENGAPEPIERPGMLWAGIALVSAYVILAPWLGFFVATVLFLAVFPWVGGVRRRPLLLASIAILGGFAIIVIFMRVAYVSLPLGEGPFRALSLALLRALGVS